MLRSQVVPITGLLALVASAIGCHAGDLVTTTTIGKPPVGARQLAFTTQPGSAATGAPLPAVRVSALDSSGALAPSFSGTVTLALGANPGSGALTGTLSETAVNGVATFADLRVDKAGTGYTLHASAAGLAAATSQAFDITSSTPPPPPPATQLGFTVQPTNTLPLQTITPAVEVTVLDAQGNPVPGFTGTVTIVIGHDASLLGNAVLSGTLSVAAVNGVARFSNLSIDQAGLGYTLRVTASGLTSAESASFNIGTP